MYYDEKNPPFFAHHHYFILIYDVSRNHSLKQRVAASIDWPSRQYYGLGGGGGRVFQASGATYYFDVPDVQAAMAARPTVAQAADVGPVLLLYLRRD